MPTTTGNANLLHLITTKTCWIWPTWLDGNTTFGPIPSRGTSFTKAAGPTRWFGDIHQTSWLQDLPAQKPPFKQPPRSEAMDPPLPGVLCHWCGWRILDVRVPTPDQKTGIVFLVLAYVEWFFLLTLGLRLAAEAKTYWMTISIWFEIKCPKWGLNDVHDHGLQQLSFWSFHHRGNRPQRTTRYVSKRMGYAFEQKSQAKHFKSWWDLMSWRYCKFL